jgi:hypothetical protein
MTEKEKPPKPPLVRQNATMDLAAMDDDSPPTIVAKPKDTREPVWFDSMTLRALRQAVDIFLIAERFEEARALQVIINGGVYYDPDDLVQLPSKGPEDNWNYYSCCSC